MGQAESMMETARLCLDVPGKLELLQLRAGKLDNIKTDIESANIQGKYDWLIRAACRLQFELDQLQAYTNELFGVIQKLEGVAKANLNEPWVEHILHAASQMTDKLEQVSSLMDTIQIAMDRVVKHQADEDCYQQA